MSDTIEALKIAFLSLLVLALVIAIANYIQQASQQPPTPQPVLIMNQPAGLSYNGPSTTALAGYYCIEGINSSSGYSIQLNAMLNNGLWIQYSYTLMPGVKGTFFNTNVGMNKSLLYTEVYFINAPCAWLVIALKNGYAYFGYSLDGKHVVWHASYHVGNATIEPGPSTELVLMGTDEEVLAQLGNGTTLVRLALYYWNGTSWEPAPVSALTMSASGIIVYTGAVNHAYVYTSGECSGIVSWPNPLNNTQCPAPPSFTPQPRPQPILVTNHPAGIEYTGPDTTALAGWYCIESINSTNGYSIQLNAGLSTAMWIQDVYSTESNSSTSPTYFNSNVWTSSLLHAKATGFINASCAWLVMAIRNGTAYFGYSLDGRSVTWYDSYPVGNASIIPGMATGIALAGYGNYAQAQLGNGTLVYLALYYWNGTNWVPAPVELGRYLTDETVNNAWAFTNGTCGGVVSLPNPVNETVCPGPPGFKP